MAIEAGVRPMEFWDMTYKENLDFLEANIKRQENEIRFRASMDHRFADLLCVGISRFLDEDAEYPSLAAAYPGIFEDLSDPDQKPQQQDWRIMKDRLMRFSDNHNKKWGDKK